jgi:hypothetical protein
MGLIWENGISDPLIERVTLVERVPIGFTTLLSGAGVSQERGPPARGDQT